MQRCHNTTSTWRFTLAYPSVSASASTTQSHIRLIMHFNNQSTSTLSLPPLMLAENWLRETSLILNSHTQADPCRRIGYLPSLQLWPGRRQTRTTSRKKEYVMHLRICTSKIGLCTALFPGTPSDSLKRPVNHGLSQ